eukprot:gnl/Spiro4/17866_TR9511_c0_g1_i1.p1 gnl/Spiro4/17866_TR9511_c0_g1~~gnl/Spiro4/17866_TR9511_c0_g1_i1.p1  ORF type:complete len:489 (-),score=51.58 gnl/Spiro4/17866_TR9511_c0_g1_i1:180-1646(-)
MSKASKAKGGRRPAEAAVASTATTAEVSTATPPEASAIPPEASPHTLLESDIASLLPEPWRDLVPIILRQPEAPKYIGPNRDWMIPSRERTFAALKVHPQDVKCVILGQDPYPREASATGIAFNDGLVKTWNNKFSPSFRNIIKSVFVHYGFMSKSDKIDTLHQAVRRTNLVSPPEWFERTMNQGVLWLNTALTFSDISPSVLKQHTRFWRPIIQQTISTLLTAKSRANAGLVFILWGDHARKLKEMVDQANESLKVPVEYVLWKHPCKEPYHNQSCFGMIEEALFRAQIPPIDWLPTTTGFRHRVPSRNDGVLLSDDVVNHEAPPPSSSADLALPFSPNSDAPPSTPPRTAAAMDIDPITPEPSKMDHLSDMLVCTEDAPPSSPKRQRVGDEVENHTSPCKRRRLHRNNIEKSREAGQEKISPTCPATPPTPSPASSASDAGPLTRARQSTLSAFLGVAPPPPVAAATPTKKAKSSRAKTTTEKRTR